MITRSRILSSLCILVLIGVFLLPTAGAVAKAIRIEFYGTELCDEASLYAERVWEAGPNFHVRGFTQTCYDTADIPQMTGTTYLYDGMVNIGKNYVINVKFRMETDEGGVWVGTAQQAADSSIIQCVGHGEGIYEGLEVFWFLDNTNGDPKPFRGYILDHRN